jgi:hypothetical protein
MAHYERDKDDHRVFDGGEDEDDGEGSQLPVVIIAAILVLAAFGGVVWLAYNQGVARGRGDAPARIAMTDVTKAGGDGGLKVYQDRAAGEDDDSAAKSATPPAAAAANQIAQAAPSATPAPVVPQATPAATAPTPPPPQQAVVTTPPPAPVAQTPAPKAAAPMKMAQAAPQPKETPPAAVAKPPVKQTVTPPPSVASTAVSPPVVATKPPTPLGLARPAAVAPTPPATPKTEVAKAAPAPATTKPAAVKAAAGSFLLQVGAYKSEEEATAAWKSYQAKHAALLSGFGPDIQRATVGDKVWYRLRIASFADKDTASAVCDRLKAQNGNCFLAH